MYVCMYLHIYKYVYIYVCMYIRMYVCIYVYIYTLIYQCRLAVCTRSEAAYIYLLASTTVHIYTALLVQKYKY